MLECPGYQPQLGGRIWDALHGERLATAGLTVGKDGAVVALQSTLDQRVGHVLVDVLSDRVHVVDAVEGEGLGRRVLVGRVDDGDLHDAVVHEDNHLRHTEMRLRSEVGNHFHWSAASGQRSPTSFRYSMSHSHQTLVLTYGFARRWDC